MSWLFGSAPAPEPPPLPLEPPAPGASVFDVRTYNITRKAYKPQSRPNSTVISNLTLVIPSGERVAIVGGSGSGKSTIFALALRFYKPSGGRVVLGGEQLSTFSAEPVDIREWSLQQLPLHPFSTTTVG